MQKGIVFLMAFFVGLAWAPDLLAADYWPTETGVEFIYENDSGELMRAEFSSSAMTEYLDGSPPIGPCWSSTWISLETSGSVLCPGVASYCAAGVDPSTWTYEQPVKFLDFPLEVGKMWEESTTVLEGGSLMFFTHEVTDETTVTVPAGTFGVFVVEVTCISTMPGTPSHAGTYYLHENLGPIILPGGWQLVEYAGIVSQEKLTWDSVKSLFW